jgi:hypothetical protein
MQASASAGEEQRALALSEYLAKAHEEKLRAIHDVERKKAFEIQELKSEIEELKAGRERPEASGAITMSTPSAVNGDNDDLMNLPKEMLVNKVLQYQAFMEKYIVAAQEQKIKAVKAAEDSVTKKLTEQLALGSTVASPALSVPAAASETALYEARSAAVTAAAAAGKSRWGDMEVLRASSVNVGAADKLPDLAEVRAADHGIKAEGSLSLAERVSMGVNAGAFAVTQASVAAQPRSTPTGAVLPTSNMNSLYQRRNARVLAAAAVGKSRWGSREIERAQALATLPAAGTASSPPRAPVPPEVVAADHGLRSEGSVGGLTLAERVAQGASTGSPSSTALPVPASPAILTLYDRRNIRVVEAAEAGKSRWGSQEVERVRGHSSALLSGSSSGRSAHAQVEAGRVNVGAQILLGRV